MLNGLVQVRKLKANYKLLCGAGVILVTLYGISLLKNFEVPSGYIRYVSQQGSKALALLKTNSRPRNIDTPLPIEEKDVLYGKVPAGRLLLYY